MEKVSVMTETTEFSDNFTGFYVEINADPLANEVEILANEPGLKYLQYIISKLIESKADGKHFHLDKVGGIEGNIHQLTIMRKVI